MIKEVSYPTEIAGFSVKKQFKNSDNKVLIPIKPHISLVNYSSGNVKANYMPLKNKAIISFGMESAGFDPSRASVPYLQPSSVPGRKLPEPDVEKRLQNINGDFYHKTADDLATLLGPADKNVLLIAEPDAVIDILSTKLQQNISNGRYQNQGLSSGMQVISLNLMENTDYGVTPLQFLEKSIKPISEQRIIFVDHFESLISTCNGVGIEDIDKVLKKKFPNDLFVGLFPKELHKHLQETDKLYLTKDDITMSKSINPIPKLEVNEFNVTDAKRFFKENPEYMGNLLARYKNVDVKFTPDAIDDIIDRTATEFEGTLPAKVFRVADLVAAAKINELNIDEAAIDKKPQILLDVPDIGDFFKNHTNIIKKLEAKTQFKRAKNITATLDDIGGNIEAKQILKDLIEYVKDSEGYVARGGIPLNAILMAGPPGNGKTGMARGVAGEAGVPFFAISGSDFVEMYVGVGSSRVRELYSGIVKETKALGKKEAVLFIDEADAIGIKRSGSSDGAHEYATTLTQLLTKMQGFDTADAEVKVIVMAATNRVDILDPALIRRFDNIIEVTNPKTPAERFEILEILSRKWKLLFGSEAEKSKILTEAAESTNGLSGDDLEKVIKNAGQAIFRRSDNKFVMPQDIIDGIKKVRSAAELVAKGMPKAVAGFSHSI